MGDSLIGLPCAEAASESRPEPVVSSDMRAARPVSVCGSRSLRSPSTSSSPGSVASLFLSINASTKNNGYGAAIRPQEKNKTYMLCRVGSTRNPSRNASYSATSSRAWRVSSASTARAKTGSFATAARKALRSRCLHASSSSPASEGKSQYGVRAQRHNGRTEADCQSTTAN